ncbi:MAG: glycosyltransferase family 2 protein [Candidatus Kerfeldbacteria bacterium]|nr:glycosyltransferase family 2 protein [Candidatus Kerfeldbacteria bacterium]
MTVFSRFWRLDWLSERRAYRVLEIFPGLAVWGSLVLAIAVSFFAPLWAIAFIVVFDVYWVVRVIYVGSYLVMGFRRYQAALRVDWPERLHTVPDWQSLHHLIMIPIAHEPWEVLRETLTSLSKIDYPLDRFIVVVATEGRYHEHAADLMANVTKHFSGTFGQVLTVEHPADLPGEVAGKGANIAWAGRQAKELVDRLHIPYDHVIVSTFDADSVAHPHYFSYLAYTYATHPDKLHTSYQPIPLFHNNIWDAMALMRVVATSTTFWLLGDTMRPDRLFTFSSHSMPFQALVDVGFWQNDVVSEDSRIFLQCFIHYDGHYTVTPMYIPISMDTVQAPSIWRSLVNQYKQIRRWAYGAENLPFMLWNFRHNHRIPLRTKLKYSWNQFEGTYSWATAPLLILLLGWLPFAANRVALESSVLANNAPLILQRLMSGAMLGLLLSAIISTVMLPKRPQHIPRYQYVMMIGQWLLLPVTMIVFGSIPAIEAQTRLMFGKYLGFFVTEKSRS